MLKRTEFFLSLNPPTTSCQNKKRGAHFTVYDAPALREAKQLYSNALKEFTPTEPFEGPLKVTLVFLFPFQKATPKKIKAITNLYKTTKPDIDNSSKLLIDRLAAYKIKGTNAIIQNFFENDNQISELYVKKKYSTTPGVYVLLEELPSVDPNPAEMEFINNYLKGE